MSEREELRFDAERVREQLRPTTEALGRMAREIAKLAPDTSAFRKAAASALRAAAGTPTHDTTEGELMSETACTCKAGYDNRFWAAHATPCPRFATLLPAPVRGETELGASGEGEVRTDALSWQEANERTVPWLDMQRKSALFNDIGRAPVERGRRLLFSDRRLLADYLWEQGWRRELRSEDYTS